MINGERIIMPESPSCMAIAVPLHGNFCFLFVVSPETGALCGQTVSVK
jgi:hypothetical protein